MDVFWCLMLMLPFHQAVSAYTEHKAVGESVTFTIPSQQNDPVAWNFNSDVVATVTPGRPPRIYFFENFKERWSFTQNGSVLTISHLRVKDAGTYTAKVFGVKTSFTLHVYKKLPMPTVTCTAQNCSSQSCSYTLRCAVQGSSLGNVSYCWRMEGRPPSEDPMMLVEEMVLEELPPVKCLVSNPVSHRDVTVTSLAALCKDNTTHPPDTGTSSRQVWIIVGSVVGTGVVLAIIIVLIVCCRHKDWRIRSLPVPGPTNIEAEVHYSTVYDCVGSAHEVHLQRVPNARRGNTKTQDTPKTIYSAVHSLAQTDEEMGNSTMRCPKQDEKSIYSRVSGSASSMNLL